MILALRVFFAVVLVTMLAVTTWAGANVPLWSIPRDVGGHPWFIATLFDAYWGFLTFYAWLWYKEPSWGARGLWLLALLLLGNIAMATYGLIVAGRLAPNAGADALLLRGEPIPLLVPAALIAAIVSVLGVTALV